MVVHSNLRFDAQPLPKGQEYLCCIVKDSQQRAFFIRIVNPRVRVGICKKHAHLCSVIMFMLNWLGQDTGGREEDHEEL